MAEGVQPSQGIGDRGVGGSEDHPRSADGRAHVARTDNTHAGCARSLIARARHHRRAGLQARAGGSGLRHLADDLLRFIESRQAVGAEPDRLQHGIGPATMRDIEQQRARGVRHVDGAHPGETEADVILGQQKAVKSPPDPGFVGPHPQQLGEREVGERGIGSQLHQALRPDGVVEIAALSRRALIAPDERRPQDLIVASNSTAPCIWPLRPMQAISEAGIDESASSLRTAPWQAFHQSCGSCSAHPLRGDAKGYVFVDSGSDDRA